MIHFSVCLLILSLISDGEQQNNFDYVLAPRHEIVRAMQAVSGYDATATTNVGRFQADVILQLANWARARHPDGPPLLIDHADWFEAFLQVHDLSRDEAPLFSRLAYRYQQDMLIEYDRDDVIEKVQQGPQPESALTVVIFWPDTSALPNKYSFEDALSVPKLQVTNHRLLSYRLLDFGDMIVYDQIQGLTGRPTTGVLAFLFKVIGEGRVEHSRMAISEDGLQIMRTRASKGPVQISETMTVKPNGYCKKDLPPDRPDLQAIENRLKQPLRIQYRPIQFQHDFLP